MMEIDTFLWHLSLKRFFPPQAPVLHPFKRGIPRHTSRFLQKVKKFKRR